MVRDDIDIEVKDDPTEAKDIATASEPHQAVESLDKPLQSLVATKPTLALIPTGFHHEPISNQPMGSNPLRSIRTD
jgi:hypothetical protein